MSSHKTLVKNKQKIFSARQEEILELITKCHSNQEIADSLEIALSTVKTHVCSIYRKIDPNYKNYGAQTLRLKTALFGIEYFKQKSANIDTQDF